MLIACHLSRRLILDCMSSIAPSSGEASLLGDDSEDVLLPCSHNNIEKLHILILRCINALISTTKYDPSFLQKYFSSSSRTNAWTREKSIWAINLSLNNCLYFNNSYKLHLSITIDLYNNNEKVTDTWDCMYSTSSCNLAACCEWIPLELLSPAGNLSRIISR